MTESHNKIIADSYFKNTISFKGFEYSTSELIWLAHDTMRIIDDARPILKRLAFAHVGQGLITAIADCFEQWITFDIECLIMRNSTICSKDAHIIADFISRSKLLRFDLLGCWIDDEALIIIMQAIEQSTVRTLSFDHYRFAGETVTAFVNCIRHSWLTKLCLWRCLIGDAEQILILESITQSSIQRLKLGSTFLFGDVGATTNLIEKSSLTGLSYDNYLLTVPIMIAIIESIKRNGAFQKIAFRFKPICDHTLDIICDLLKNSTIENVKFSGQSLFDAQIVRLCDAMKASPIVSLSMQCNRISEDAMLAICDLLVHSKMASIKLIACSLRSTSVVRLCAAIQKSSLVSLDLQSNCGAENLLCEDSSRAMCDLLENHNLQKLNLSYNSLSDVHIIKMLPSVRKSSLIDFNFEQTLEISKDITDEIEEIVQIQKNISDRFRRTKSSSNSQVTS